MTVCQGCEAGLPPSKAPGRKRKWCSERCRKNTLYGGTCVDCGSATSYSGHGTEPHKRCPDCGHAASAATQKVWTRDATIAAVKAWAAEFGEPPTQSDWQPYFARRLGDPARAERFQERRGEFPTHNTVHREFGSWNAAIVAAGFEPRPAHGGGGNGARRRSIREPVTP